MSKKRETNEEFETFEEMPIKETVVEETKPKDKIQPVVTKPKESILEKFIGSKPELARYSMSTAFSNFCAKNKAAYNDLKTKEDIQKAFDKFFT